MKYKALLQHGVPVAQLVALAGSVLLGVLPLNLLIRPSVGVPLSVEHCAVRCMIPCKEAEKGSPIKDARLDLVQHLGGWLLSDFETLIMAYRLKKSAFQRSLGKGRPSAVWMVRCSVDVHTHTGIVAPSLVCPPHAMLLYTLG